MRASRSTAPAQSEPIESRLLLSIAFFPPVQSPIGSTAVFVSADFTGDRKADLVAKGADGAVRFFRGRGDGTFEPATNAAAPVPAGGNVTSLTVADVDRDGKQDLIATNGPSMLPVLENLRVLRGNGNGTFAVTDFAFAGGGPVAVVVTDVNRDGKLDVAVANRGIWSGSSAPVSYGAGLLLGNGDGTLQPVRKIALPGPQHAIAAPGANLSAPATSAFRFALGGEWIQSASPLARAVIYTVSALNTGSYNVDHFLPFFGRIGGLGAGDLNRDGRPDLAALQVMGSNTTVAGDSTVHTFVMRNDGTFGAKTIVPAGLNAGVGLSLADFDRDGRLDVAVAGRQRPPLPSNAAHGVLSVLRGDGTGALALPRLFRAGPTPLAQTLADVNGDGRTDIVVGNVSGVASLLSALSPTSVFDRDFTLDEAEQPLNFVAA